MSGQEERARGVGQVWTSWARRHGAGLVVAVVLVVVLAVLLVMAGRTGRAGVPASASAASGQASLAQETLCGVFSSQRLAQVLEMRVYSASTNVVRAGSDTVEVDDIPEVYQDAEELGLEGVEGQGWAWTAGVTAFVAWRFPDGHTALARLTSWEDSGPTLEQQNGFHAVLARALARLPQVASGPARPAAPEASPVS